MNNQTLNSSKIRGIYIPMYDPPSIIEDSFASMKSYIFYNSQTYTKTFDNDICFIMSLNYVSDSTKVNFLATTLIRSLYLFSPANAINIHGPALVVGMNKDTDKISVSYNLIDTIANLMQRYKYDN